MKLHAILEAKYHLGQGQIELTQAKDISSDKHKEFTKAVSAAWPHGVMYKGKSIYKLVYLSDVLESLEKYLEENNRDEEELSHYSSQESYLGYVPSKDLFIQGFDTWGELEDDGSYDEEETDEYSGTYEPELSNVMLYRLKDGKISYQQSRYNRDHMMYPNVLRSLHYEFKDLIDVRLD